MLAHADRAEVPAQLPAVPVDPLETEDDDIEAAAVALEEIDEAETVDVDLSDSAAAEAAPAAQTPRAGAATEKAAVEVKAPEKPAPAQPVAIPQPALADGLIEPDKADEPLPFAARLPDDPGPDGELLDDDDVARRAVN